MSDEHRPPTDDELASLQHVCEQWEDDPYNEQLVPQPEEVKRLIAEVRRLRKIEEKHLDIVTYEQRYREKERGGS